MFGIDYSTNSDYQEILKLDRMLTDASIPHTLDRLFDGWQVCYPTREEPELVMDTIEHYGSYGKDEDKLEIMGLLTPDEEEHDSVLGYLTAEDVFERIRKHHNGEWDKYVNDLVKKTSEEDTEKDDSPESSDSHIMTPEEFAKAMKTASYNLNDPTGHPYYDEEDAHREMDGIMANLLRQLGYGKGIDIFENTNKWYS